MRTLASAVMTLLLLAGLGVQRMSLPQPKDAEPYHQAIQEVLAAIPEPEGGWTSADIPLPPAAVSMLRPNVTLSKRYIHEDRGLSVQFILIHCGDARDMAGHYPPICYPNSGWTLKGRTETDWGEGDQALHGVEYRFEQVHMGRTRRLIVANVILLPDGTFATDMESMKALETDYRHRFFGAAQMQFIFDHEVAEDERRSVIAELIARYDPVIRTIRSGVHHGQ